MFKSKEYYLLNKKADDVFKYQGRLCVSMVDGLQEKIMKEDHICNTPYPKSTKNKLFKISVGATDGGHRRSYPKPWSVLHIPRWSQKPPKYQPKKNLTKYRTTDGPTVRRSDYVCRLSPSINTPFTHCLIRTMIGQHGP